MYRIHMREGFEGQVHYVIPRQLLRDVENHPLLHALYPTDIGYYPAARYHYRERREGAAEHILIYCVGGEGWVNAASTTHALTHGHACIIPSGVPHAYGASLDDPWTIHWVHFRGEIAYQFVQQMRDGNGVIAVDAAAHQPIVQTFEECYAALASSFGVRQVIFCALEIHRILGWLFFRNEAFAPNQTDLPDPVKKALAYMRAHVQRRPSLAQLAAHAGVSVSHFSFLFKTSLGIAPIDYFIDLKMQYACHLLETTSLTVKEVAFALDYDDPYYFSRLFRKVIGLSPIYYRKGANM